MRSLLLLVPLVLVACSGAPTGGEINSGGDNGNGNGSGNGNANGNGNGNGSGNGNGNGNSNGGDGAFSIPSHPAMAQLASNGGPVLKSPKVVAVTFDGDPLRTQIEDFASKLGPSEYWKTVVSEYGVGPATSMNVHVSTAAPKAINDTAIQTFLKANIKSGGLLGAPDANAVYVMLYPTGTVVTQGTGQDVGTGCKDFGGYHDELTIGGTKIAYAVVPRCAAFPPAPAKSLTGMDFVSTAMSHELAEAATDPHPNSEPAFAGTDDDDLVWAMMTGGENGDMCAGIDDFSVKPADLGYTVQRLWSNAAAKASHDPCVPAPSEAYFNAAFAPADALTIADPSGQGPSMKTKGLKMAVGQSKTIDLTLYSDQATGDFKVSALDASGSPILDFKLDKTSGKSGDTVKLTVTLKSAPQGGVEPFVIASTLNGVTNQWYGLVGE